MIGIIDCNIGNIGSLRNAFAYLGASAEVVRDPGELDRQDAIVLPGVGAFDAAMMSLDRSGFGAAVVAYAGSGRPVLGICLGLQVLCNGSEEGALPGLGVIDGAILNLRALGCRGKIPHVGFNAIDYVEGESQFLAPTVGQDFYFVHSFGLQTIAPGARATAVARVEYAGVKFVAALQRDNVFATQFHPEKSGAAGLQLLRQFLLCSRSA